MRGADVVHRVLVDLGVKHVFTIVSIHNMPIIDAIRRGGGIDIIDVRHEQGGTHSADGYARATGGLGVMIASTGPGTTNTVTGLYEAAYSSVPVLLITGQAESGFYGKGQGYVHENEKQIDLLRSVVRRVESPRHVNDIAGSIHRCVADMLSGRRQPGAVEIPVDLQYGEAGNSPPRPVAPWTHEPDQEAISAVVEAIRGSSKRLILAGGGVVDAGEALTRLAETLDAPVFTTTNGRGAIAEDHALAGGNLFASRPILEAAADADVTIAVGTRFQVGVRGSAYANVPPGKLIHIDVDPSVIGRTHRADLALVGDAGLALNALSDQLSGATGDAQFREKTLAASRELKAFLTERIGPDYASIMASMRELLPRDGLVVRDSTVPAYNFGNQLLPILNPRTSMSPNSGAIGPGLPIGIGAAVGSGRKTLIIHGDGGFMLHAPELATAAQYKVPVIVCVFNDGGYGVLRGLQSREFDGRYHEVDLGFVDFARMAQSMGVSSERITSADAFNSAMRTAVNHDGPYLIEIDMRELTPMRGSILPREQGAS